MPNVKMSIVKKFYRKCPDGEKMRFVCLSYYSTSVLIDSDWGRSAIKPLATRSKLACLSTPATSDIA